MGPLERVRHHVSVARTGDRSVSGARVARIGKVLRGIVVAIGTFVAFVVLLNGAAWVILALRAPARAPCKSELCRPMPLEFTATARPRIAPRASRTPNVTIGPEGFRINAATPSTFHDYSPTARSIFVFGGSTTFGSGVADDETVPADLQRRLDATRDRVRVYNLGQPSYRFIDEIYLLLDRLREGRLPTVVVFYDGVNEQCYTVRGREGQWHPLYGRINDAMEIATRAPLLVFENFPLYALMTRLRDRLGAIVRGERGRFTTGEDFTTIYTDIGRCAGSYREGALFVLRLSREFGFTPVFVLQPSGAFLDDPASYRFPTYEPPSAARVANYRALYRQIIDDAKAGSYVVWDLSDLLRRPAAAGEAVFVDWQHPTSRGNALIAARLADILAGR
jgi:hypothetical protein